MNRKTQPARQLSAAIAALLLAAAPFGAARASEASDCMFDCAPVQEMSSNAAPLFCKPQALVEVEAVGAKVKQVKDLVKLLQSPTGIALKLVNDHVVEIPEWVGYVADPKGAIKNKVMSLARSELKKATGLDRACVAPSATDAQLPAPETVDTVVETAAAA